MAEPREGAEDRERPQSDPEVRLAALEARNDELLRAYAALVEEQKAYRARTERERERVLAAERAQVAQALFEAMDELERVLGAATGEAPGAGPEAAVMHGVRLAHAVLAKRAAELGAERLALVGAPFDPRVAEAVDLVPVGEAEADQVVVSEVRSGWRLGDRVLRPARVRVGRFVPA
jgi:molecular chaperone GrpE